jgi:serine/threonine-protein kinase
MAKHTFWKSDWFSGLIITIIFIFFSGSAAVQGIERWAYDIGVTASDRSPADNISIIAIDDVSIANLGRWPWSRDIHAQMLASLNEAGAKVIAPSILFIEAQQDSGAKYLKAIQSFFEQSSLGTQAVEDSVSLQIQMDDLNKTVATTPAKEKTRPIYLNLQDLDKFYTQSSLKEQMAKDLLELNQYFNEAGEALNQDKMLAKNIAKSGNVVLPMLFELGAPQGNPDQPLPEYVTSNVIADAVDNIGAASLGAFPTPAQAAFYPIPQFGNVVSGIAHLNQLLDVDGGIRKEPLVIDYFGEFYPSFSLMVAARSLNLSPSDIQVKLGEGVSLKRLNIATDSQLRMNTFFYSDHIDGSPAFTTDSFFDVISGKIPVSKYKNKIVLIGQTASGISTPQKTPVDEAMHPVLTLAHSVSSILQEDFFVTPPWADTARLVSLLVIAIYLIALLPRLSAGLAFVVTALLLIGFFSGEYYFMTSEATWVPLMSPFLLLIFGYVLLTTKRFLWTERSKVAVEMDSSETNRMLGIAFQGQGQLDMAFEKYRKCTVDETVLDSLYNLALDYERKRQFNKSGSVYRYMSDHDPKFRDIQDRMSRSEQMENTMVVGGGGAGPGATMILDGAEKPMLGRYQVEKELGKGAMGMVYLGRDPKINRIVAIKTMALSQEFEEDELDEVKERFFREAESAGRLSHPNIVTIYDAGDEQDLAYIAMELLKGDDLTKYMKRDNLLPVSDIARIIAETADALSYAHAQNIVHRDIKPANIMYEPEAKITKVTDFGIARITDSSKTKTGVVLGTPSYMSPEQLSGKHVDGRSDLFSLGVTLYQMLTGELPFQADSLATLMFKITNEEPSDIKLLRPELPDCLVKIVNRSLSKSTDDRYQTGSEMKADLEACSPAINFEYGNQ